MCKTNDKNISPCKSSFAHEIHVSWLYYGDIKIRDCFVYEHILTLHIYVSYLHPSKTNFKFRKKNLQLIFQSREGGNPVHPEFFINLSPMKSTTIAFVFERKQKRKIKWFLTAALIFLSGSWGVVSWDPSAAFELGPPLFKSTAESEGEEEIDLFRETGKAKGKEN